MESEISGDIAKSKSHPSGSVEEHDAAELEIHFEEDGAQNPLVKYLPSKSASIEEYMSYLTVVEQETSRDNLDVLLQVLQDVSVTEFIGWDLIHLLLPFLPESKQCLEQIAKNGNSKEVLLKVAESLRAINFDIEDDVTRDGVEAQQTLPILQLDVLLSMLSTLHRRIKTKYPSRFMSTSLQAVLAALSEAPPTNLTDLLPKIKSLIGLLISISLQSSQPPPRSAAPAAEVTSSESVSKVEPSAVNVVEEDAAISKKLLQAFITHLIELFLAPKRAEYELPGLSWSAGLFEKYHPQKVVPDRQTYIPWVTDDAVAERRLATINEILALTQLLDIELEDILAALVIPAKQVNETQLDAKEAEEDDVDPPDSPEDIPLSKPGCVLLYTAKIVPGFLDPEMSVDFYVEIFPHQFNLLNNLIGTEEAGGISMAGTEPEAIIDSVLALGLLALEYNKIGEPKDDLVFNEYLQRISLLAANTPSSSLRFHAHYITTTVLRSHPYDVTRLAFIRDTLENCPYENLRTVAVGWMKGETVEANSPTNATRSETETSIFATPAALQSVASYLFPNLASFFKKSSIEENWAYFKMNVSFYLAVLNFDYLLITATRVRQELDVAGLHEKHQIHKIFLEPLRNVSEIFTESLSTSGQVLFEMESAEGIEHAKSDLMVLDDALERCERALRAARMI